jgi:hypothetical protein
MGCHLMVSTGSLAVILGRLSVGVVFGWPLTPAERLGIYALVAVGLAWRLSIFIRTQILRRRARV